MTAPISKQADTNAALAFPIILSVDTMGGDQGPAAVVAGCAKSAKKNSDLGFILHGPEDELTRLVARRKGLAARCLVRNATGVVTMEDKPSHVVRTGKDTSMSSPIEQVRSVESDVAVSCGNTGALMAISMIRLRKLPGVNRPAIAVLYPSSNAQG